ncbi:MAG: hypothetical protein AB7O39_03585 [Flavobacteriaceae bacterium]
MNYVAAGLAGIAGTIIGWLVAAFLAVGLGGVLGIGEREGALAMTAFFAIGPVGGLIGLILAVWLLMRWRRRHTMAVTAGHLAAAIAGVGVAAGVIAGGFWVMRPHTASNRLPPELVFEIVMPSGSEPPPLVSRSEALARRSPIELQTSENTMSAQIESVRMEGVRLVVSGRVEMAHRTRDRVLVFKQPAGDVVFSVDLPRSPGHEKDFTGWEVPTVPAGGVRLEGFHIRYRSVLPGEE